MPLCCWLQAALSLLESALLLRGGLDAPVGRPPTLADITAVEAATGDALVRPQAHMQSCVHVPRRAHAQGYARAVRVSSQLLCLANSQVADVCLQVA